MTISIDAEFDSFFRDSYKDPAGGAATTDPRGARAQRRPPVHRVTRRGRRTAGASEV